MTTKGPLSRYRILDLSDMKGDLGTLYLAHLGADVIRVEHPHGHSTRWIPPFAGNIPHVERGLYHLYRNVNKRGITLDIETSEGQDILKRLVKTADVFVECFQPGYLESLKLGYSDLKEVNSKIIMASITDWGQSGPRRDFEGAPIVAMAMSGAMQMAGFSEKEPCDAPNAMAYDMAAVYAGTGIMIALYGRGDDGEGEWLDISAQEAGIAGLFPWSVPMTTYGTVPGGNDFPVRGALMLIYKCKDGYVKIAGNVPRHWEAQKELIGKPEMFEDKVWDDQLFRRENADTLKIMYDEFIQDRTMQDLFIAGQALGLPITPLQSLGSFVESPQTKSRNFFQPLNHQIVGEYEYPSAPLKMNGTPLSLRKSAPLLGEDNNDIYSVELGIDADELNNLRSKGVI
jgi:crotonobetainyl-CoA:carnitine CoA-transferase CaiB-like acyl-CoA transferase